MALGNSPPAPEAWARWPQQHHSGTHYNMMPTSMVPYDSRTAAGAAVPRPENAHHFLPVAFSQAPVPSPTTSHFQAPISYGGYNPYSSPPMMDAPFRTQEGFDRVPPRFLPVGIHADGGMQDRVDGLSQGKRSCSPAVKSETRSTMSASPSLSADIPTTPGTRDAPVHQFDTAIDNIVRVIEAKREIIIPSDTEEPTHADKKEDSSSQPTQGKTKRRRFCCDFKGCHKTFKQKNNLDTHQRSHTGESPYACPYCPSRFTQGANLNAHINRHTGAKPYKCPQCPRTFAQPSNVKAHAKTHVRRELRAHWVCRFANCQKAFTAKGNLKNHQNTYHVEAIEAFNAKLAAVENQSTLSKEEKEMAKYLADVHNLANKGIKGRGKGRKVKRVLMLHPPHQHQQQQLPSPPATSPISPSATTFHATTYPMTLLQHGLPHMHHHHHASLPSPPRQQQHMTDHHHPHGLPIYGASNPAAYSMSRQPNNMLFGGSGAMTRDTYGSHGGYGMLDSDQLSDASSVHGATPGMHFHDEEHGRGGGFW